MKKIEFYFSIKLNITMDYRKNGEQRKQSEYPSGKQ